MLLSHISNRCYFFTELDLEFGITNVIHISFPYKKKEIKKEAHSSTLESIFVSFGSQPT